MAAIRKVIREELDGLVGRLAGFGRASKAIDSQVRQLKKRYLELSERHIDMDGASRIWPAPALGIRLRITYPVASPPSVDYDRLMRLIGPVTFAKIFQVKGAEIDLAAAFCVGGKDAQGRGLEMDKQTLWSEHVAELGGTRATIYVDGGAWPTNPGHGAIGLVVISPDKQIVYRERKYLGTNFTNNDVEYAATLRAVELAKELGLVQADLRSDSQLVVNQIKGTYKIYSSKFDALIDRFHKLARGFQHVSLEWVPREENELANHQVALIRKMDWGPAAPVKKDGRDFLTQFLVNLLERNDVKVERVVEGYIHLAGIKIRPSPYYLRSNDRTVPSIEKDVWDAAQRMNQQTPVVIAWRPQGLHKTPLNWETLGILPREDFQLANDMQVEPLFAFVDDLKIIKSGDEVRGPTHGFRGSQIFLLEGSWRTTKEFLWFCPGGAIV